MLNQEKSIIASISKDDISIQCAVGVGKGDKGEKGDDGYTPQKGIDYFTEEDIEALELDKRINKVLETELDTFLDEVNTKLSEHELNIESLKKSDEDTKLVISGVLDKIESLVRYSKGEIHPVDIY